MNGLFKYADLAAKISAMRGKMLTEEDMQGMMNCGTVKEIALYLKNNTSYREVLLELDENDVHRGALEVLLYRGLVSDALKLAKHMRGVEKRLYRFIYRKLEVEDLKRMLRRLRMGGYLEDIDRQSLFISKYSRIDFNKSLKSRSIHELLETIKHTNFYNVLNPLVSTDGEIDMFAAEMALDLYYYSRTDLAIQKMPNGKDKSLVKEIEGVEIDFKNIFWILRAKKYFDIPKEILYRYLIPGGHRLKSDMLRTLIETRDSEDLLSLLGKTYYGKRIDFSSSHMEVEFWSFMKHLQDHTMRNNPFSISPVIGYVFLKEVEVKNVTNIVEGIRYGVGPEVIENYLIGL